MSGAALVVTALAAPAAAQDGGRPSDGLFGGGSRDQGATKTLDATVALSAGHDDNGARDTERVVPEFGRTGTYELLTGSLTYLARGERVQWGVGGGSSVRYQHEEAELLRAGDYGAFGIAARLGRRWNVSASQGASCSPVNLQPLFGDAGPSVPGLAQVGAALPSTGDYSLDRLRACSFDTSGRVSVDVARRSTIELSTGVGRVVFEPGSGYRTLNSYLVGGRFLHTVSQRMRLNLGYTKRASQYGLGLTGEPTERAAHDIDLGADYQRPLSLTRRTTLDFGAGSTAVTEETSGTQRLRYGVTGQASLNHQFLRTWSTRVSYSRGLSFVTGLSGPVFSDGVTVTTSGLLSRRVQLFLSGDARAGDVGAAGEETSFTAYNANARRQVALARNWAVTGEYTDYAHDLAPGAVSFAVPFSMHRQSARIGLTWWHPLLRR